MRRLRSFHLTAALVVAAAATLALPATAHGSDDVPTQWQIDARAEALQRAPEPAEKPVICIIDTGVTPTPDLDIVSRTALDGGTPDDVTAIPGHYGHGTTVAHMAAAKVNGWGSSGAFPHARIASVRIFDRDADSAPWPRYVSALRLCRSLDPQPVVAVLALGKAAATPEEEHDLRTAVAISRNRYGMSVVAAAGNGGGALDMPARFPESFAVAAATSAGPLCDFSARGANLDVMAPGCELEQSGWDGKRQTLSGTSFAAPAAAGIIAALRAYTPADTAAAAEEVIVRAAAGPFRGLNAEAALRASGVLWLKTSRGAEAADPEASPGEDVPPLAPAGSDAIPDGGGELAAAAAPLTRRTARVTGRRNQRWPLPRLRVTRRGDRIVFRVVNRPTSAAVEVEARRRRFTVRRSAFALRAGSSPRRLRVRFVRELTVSPWNTVSTGRAQRST